MSNKRIFLIHEDRIVTNLYREKLEGSGFSVDTSRQTENAVKTIEQRKPDLVVLDLVFQSGKAVELIAALRADPNTMGLPILIFPNSLPQLANAAIEAGANRVIPRGRQPIGALIDAAKTALGMEGLGDAVDAQIFSPDEEWMKSIASSAIESINQMRHCIPGLVSTPPDIVTLASLWGIFHGFAERIYFFGNRAISQFAAAFDLMLADLNEMPEQLNHSTLRTIGQAIDFMGVLMSADRNKLEKEPSSAKILIVDDEESALQFITAAMQLAGLKNDTASSPTSALEKLDGKASDLIFLDVGLPEMSGFDLCQKIRALDAHEKTPIVFLTGMATFQNKAQASLSGGNDFVGKPFNLPELGVKALMWLLRGQLAMI
jgi:DNA-binding response OmpR family regulator